jgi:hypothetical protein
VVQKKDSFVTAEMVEKYYELNKKKKEIELEMTELKEVFNDYFNNLVGPIDKGEITVNGYKLQRLVRKTERFNEEVTVKKLEELQMNDLIQVVRKPDDAKIKAALNLGLLNEKQLAGCISTAYSPAISVKTLTPR